MIDPDVDAINRLLDQLRSPARLGTLAGEAQSVVACCRLEIAAVRERLRTRPDWAPEIADGVLAEVDDRLTALAEDLDLADLADTTNRLASAWRRGGARGTPLGTVELPDGRQVDVADELHADALFHEGYEMFVREPDATHRRAIKQTLKTLLDLMQPGERGARVEGSSDDWPRVGCDPQTVLTVYDDLVALLRRRPDHGHELPDVWEASCPDTPGFGGMTPTEIAARLIARRLGFAPETGHERVGDLLTDARGTRDAGASLAGITVILARSERCPRESSGSVVASTRVGDSFPGHWVLNPTVAAGGFRDSGARSGRSSSHTRTRSSAEPSGHGPSAAGPR